MRRVVIITTGPPKNTSVDNAMEVTGEVHDKMLAVYDKEQKRARRFEPRHLPPTATITVDNDSEAIFPIHFSIMGDHALLGVNDSALWRNALYAAEQFVAEELRGQGAQGRATE